MVLTRLRWLAVLCAAAVPACTQSLFDSHGAGPGNPDGGRAGTCVAPCLADAALDFDGTASGKNQRWRYLDDHRDRTWTAMTPGSGAMTGADSANQIATCASKPGAAACAMLPGALLVSSAGATSMSDPAIELTSPGQQVVQLSLRAYLPSGPDQTIRLYRNSREDVLFTGLATAGVALEQMITVDALAADRFLVAVAPSAQGAADLGLQFVASSASAVFPSTCLLAVGFTGATGNAVTDLCKGATLSYLDDSQNPAPLAVGGDPFGRQGGAADIVGDRFYRSNQTIPQNTALTVQLWIRQRSILSEPAWPFSDLDFDATGGLGIAIGDAAPQMLDVTTCTNENPLEFIDVLTEWPAGGDWHFVRVVQAGGSLDVCVDGKRKGSAPTPDGQLKTTFAPHIGKNVRWTPAGEYFDGNIADVRVFTGALPCN
jgi:hypothetical protein